MHLSTANLKREFEEPFRPITHPVRSHTLDKNTRAALFVLGLPNNEPICIKVAETDFEKGNIITPIFNENTTWTVEKRILIGRQRKKLIHGGKRVDISMANLKRGFEEPFSPNNAPY